MESNNVEIILNKNTLIYSCRVPIKLQKLILPYTGKEVIYPSHEKIVNPYITHRWNRNNKLAELHVG